MEVEPRGQQVVSSGLPEICPGRLPRDIVEDIGTEVPPALILVLCL